MASHKRYYIVLLILFFSVSTVSAQINSYIIYLKDKHGTTGSLDQPEMYLSSKSIEKRDRYGIRIDSTDLPVSQNYLNQILAAGCEIVYTSKWMNAVHIKATAIQYTQVAALPFVKSTEHSFRTSLKENIHHIEAVQQTNYASYYEDVLGVTQMHQSGILGTDILIAVTDAGFPGVDTLRAFSHLFTNNQLVYSFDVAAHNAMVYDGNSHGTAVLSILAAYSDSYIGVVPEADYILLRTEVAETESKMEEYNWLRAAEIADSCGADIISVSLGYTTFDQASHSYSYSDMNGVTSIIAQAADMAYNKGIIVVSSAGNDGNNYWKYIDTPADALNVITVGAVDAANHKTGFSSVGPTADGRMKPDLCAPGSVIYCLKPDGSLNTASGTSVAAPMISGFIAGMMQAFPQLSRDEIKSMVFQSCDEYLAPTNLKGFGVPGFEKAVMYARIFTNKNKLLIAPNPYQTGALTLKVHELNESYSLNVLDNQGRILFNGSYYSDEKLIHLEADFEHFHSGFYFIIVESNYGREIIKWIKL